MSFEDVLGSGPLELTAGVPSQFGDSTLSMGLDPDTGHRGFRLIHPREEPPLSDAAVIAVQVFGYSKAGCRGGTLCRAGTGNGLILPFGPPQPPGQGDDLLFESAYSDGSEIARLMQACSCGTKGVVSVEIRVDVRLIERQDDGTR